LSKEPILEVNNLSVGYFASGRKLTALDNVSFELKKGEVLAVVGESGSGKSTLGLSIMRLLPASARVLSGSIRLNGEEILQFDNSRLNRIRGSKVAMIFQEPVSYLNPVLKVGEQVTESIILHRNISNELAKRYAIEALKKVKIPDPEKVYNYYPHQLSGGMAQRVCIAIAISNSPSLLIADEPTTSLDLTIQAQILHLLKELCSDMHMSMLLISHDLRVVSGVADRVLTLYAGRVVEERSVKDIFLQPLHPYTRVLLKSSGMLRDDRNIYDPKGSLPDMHDPPEGCRFAPRCPHAFNMCTREPKESRVDATSRVYCWLYEEG
jgi:peptide/nickel transport system ATP-binding protein